MTPASRGARPSFWRLGRRLTSRLLVLTVAFVVLAAILFGPQLVSFWLSLKASGVAVHNASRQPLIVSAVSPDGQRAFYRVEPSATRLIPDGRDELITILDRDCRILDAHTRGHQPPAFLVADVSTSGTTTWRAVEPPTGIAPAPTTSPCVIR